MINVIFEYVIPIVLKEDQEKFLKRIGFVNFVLKKIAIKINWLIKENEQLKKTRFRKNGKEDFYKNP